MRKREFSRIWIIASIGVVLLGGSLLLLSPSDKQVRVYNKDFELVDVEYNSASVISHKRFKEKLRILLFRLGAPQRILDKLRESQRSRIFEVRATRHATTPADDTVSVYFKWPYSWNDLCAVLMDQRGKKIWLRLDARGIDPNIEEKDLTWCVPRGRTDSNSVYTLHIIRSVETNAFELAEIKLGRLGNLKR